MLSQLLRDVLRRRSISTARLVKVYMDTRESMWLPAIVRASLVSGSAVTVVVNTVWVYERQEVVKIPITHAEVLVEFQREFENFFREISLVVGNAESVAKKRKLNDA